MKEDEKVLEAIRYIKVAIQQYEDAMLGGKEALKEIMRMAANTGVNDCLCSRLTAHRKPFKCKGILT